MRGEASLKLHKDVGSLAKSYLSAQKMIGADKIAIPGKNATPDDWKQVYTKLGLPESVEKYEVKVEGQTNPELLGKFKQVAHAAGILPSQAEKLLEFYGEINKNASDAIQAQQKTKLDEGIAKLKTEWGEGWDNEVAAARAAKETFGDENFDKFLTENNLRSHPEMIKFLNKVGKTLGEDTIRGQGGGKGGMTPADAKAKIESLKGDLTGPYYNGDHPNHKAAVAEVQKLYELAYPGQAS
jgi:hypothetical protein